MQSTKNNSNSKKGGLLLHTIFAFAILAIIYITAVAASELPYIYFNGEKLYIHPTDNSAGVSWSPTYTATGAQSNTNGSANTVTIVNYHGAGTNYAAGLCDNLSFGGYDDWYLPAKDQLSQMDNQFAITNISMGDYAGEWANFAASWYWSSTEYSSDPGRAWGKVFGSGPLSDLHKSSNVYVRCVRDYTPPLPTYLNSSNCTASLSSAGATYVLSSDMSCDNPSYNSLTVSADNITIDCNGNSISNPSGFGLYISFFNRTTVKNCNISSNRVALYLYNAYNGNFTNNRIANNNESESALNMLYSSNNAFTYNNFTSAYVGAWVDTSSDNNTFAGNKLIGSSESTRVYSNSNNTFVNNTMNGPTVLSLSSNNNFTRNKMEASFIGLMIMASSDNNTFDSNNITSTSDHSMKIWNSNNNTFRNNNLTGYNSGAELQGGYSNTFIGNRITSVSYYGVYITSASYYGVFINNTVNSGSTGIRLESGPAYNNFTGNNVTSTYNQGVYFNVASNNTFTGNNLTGTYGVLLDTCFNNTFASNNLTGLNDYGIRVAFSSNNSFFNNKINGSASSVSVDTDTNYWNTTLSCSPGSHQNVIGGDCLGGNYHATLSGTGFSENVSACMANSSSLCSNSYNIESGNVDNYPLTSLPPALTCGVLSSPGTYTLIANISSNSGCFDIDSNDVILDCDGYTITYAQTSGGYGIFSDGHSRVTVKNCNLVQGAVNFGSAMSLDGLNFAIYDVNITTIGNISQGILLQGNNSIISGNNHITTSGNNSFGLYINECNNVTISANNTIVVSGNDSTGMQLRLVTNSTVSGESNITTSGNDVASSSSGPFGIVLDTSTNVTISGNNTITTSGDGAAGIAVAHGGSNRFTGNNTVTTSGGFVSATGSSAFGIAVLQSSNNVFSGMNVIRTTGSGGSAGIELIAANNNNFTNNHVTSEQTYAFVFADAYGPSTGNLIYNNFLNGSSAPALAGTGSNFWNTTLNCAGQTNIIGGSCIGGNFYANAAGTGFSQNATACSVNSSGLCGNSYSINENNTDNYPLSTVPVPQICGSLDSPGTVYTMTKNVTSEGTCFTILADNVTLDCDGYTINYANSSQGYGINVTGYHNVTIKDCNVVERTTSYNPDIGIFLSNSNNSNIMDVNVTTIGTQASAIYVVFGFNDTISGRNTLVTSGNGAYGIIVNSGYNQVVSAANIITTSGSESFGITLPANNCTLSGNNIITTSGDAGVALFIQGSNNSISGNNTFTTSGNLSSTLASGISIFTGGNNTVSGNNVISTSGVAAMGIMIQMSDGNKFTGNNTINTTGPDYYATYGAHGIALIIASNNTFSGRNIIHTAGNLASGIALLGGSMNNTIANSNATSEQSYGLELADLIGTNNTDNLFYNNMFNGYVSPVSAHSTNYWSTTLNCVGQTNIIGGSCIGGNFYANAAGTGFSQNATACSVNSSGLCSLPYDMLGDATNVDTYPLTLLEPPLDCSELNQSNSVYTMTQNVSSNGTCFFIMANNVTLDCNGHSITGNTSDNGVYSSFNSTTIRNCIIKNFSNGINIASSSNGSIVNNTFYNSTMAINLYRLSFSVVANNTLADNTDGIWLSETNHTDVYGNSLTSSSIQLVGAVPSVGNRIYNNNLTGTMAATYMKTAIGLRGSYNLAENNTIFDSDGFIFVGGDSNNFTNNNLSGISLPLGTFAIYVLNGTNGQVSRNTIVASGGDITDAILLNDVGTHNNVVDSNNITFTSTMPSTPSTSYNPGGIALFDGPTDNTIINNRIISTGNYSHGIWVGTSSGNIFYNNLLNATFSPVITDGSANDWNTTLHSGTNIIGGGWIGGNYYANGAGTGFSQNATACAASSSGLCTNAYDILNDATNLDNYPLTSLSEYYIDCGNLTSSGTYTLTRNISSNSTCFNVRANNVTLDCRGYTITYATSSSGQGIFVQGNRTVVKNCIIQQNNNSITSAQAIKIDGGMHGEYRNNTISTNGSEDGSGIYITGGAINTTVIDNEVHTYGFKSSSIMMDGAYNGSISNNMFTASYSSGTVDDGSFGIIFVDTHNFTMRNNTIITTGDSGEGIIASMSTGNSIIENRITTSGTDADGLFFRISVNNNTVSFNNISSNTHGMVIYISSNNTLASNDITSMNAVYFETCDDNMFANNTAVGSNYGAYLHSASGNSFINNTLKGQGSYGVQFDSGSNNTFTNNIVSSTSAADFWSSDSLDNKIYNMTFNGTSYPATVSFTYYGNVSIDSVSPVSASTYANVTKYLNITNSSEAWVYLNVSYSDGSILPYYEPDLRMYSYNGSAWNLASGTNGVDTSNNIVYANVSSFSVLAPLAPLDLVYPVVTLSSPAANAWFNITNVNFTFSASDDRSSNLNCSIYVNGTLRFTNSSVLNNTATSFTVSSLSNGLMAWHVNCSDVAGNRNVSASRNFAVDTVNPTITSFTLSSTSVNVGDTITPTCTATDNSESYGGSVTTNVTGIDTTSSGSKVATCTATDSAGRIAVQLVSYSVAAPYVPSYSSGGSSCNPDWVCTEWSDCSPSGIRTRTCNDTNNCGTTRDKPVESATCVYICISNWQCSDWTACSVDGFQTRSCSDAASCSISDYIPTESRSCIYIPSEVISEDPTDRGIVGSISEDVNSALQSIQEGDYSSAQTSFANAISDVNILLTTPNQNNTRVAELVLNKAVETSNGLIVSGQTSTAVSILSNVSSSAGVLASSDSSLANSIAQRVFEASVDLLDEQNLEASANVLSSLIGTTKSIMFQGFVLTDDLELNRLDPNSILSLAQLGTSVSAMSSTDLELDGASQLLLNYRTSQSDSEKLSLLEQVSEILQDSFKSIPEVTRTGYQTKEDVTTSDLLSQLSSQVSSDSASNIQSMAQHIQTGGLRIEKEMFVYTVGNAENSSEVFNVTVVKLHLYSPVQMKNLTIVEYIPKSFADSASDIIFSVQPTILEDDPLISWSFNQTLIGESRTITYVVNSRADSLSTLAVAAGEVQLAPVITTPEYQEPVYPERTEQMRIAIAAILSVFIIVAFLYGRKIIKPVALPAMGSGRRPGFRLGWERDDRDYYRSSKK